ncbi:MAG TPA: apolipoprotein N-acyltransferase, partial [Spirochaetia bacterium]|nr:apolipoprotein N-acyltransferase [Spirochaetia bacterium]
ISLQVTIIVFFLLYILFMPAALWLFRKIRTGRFLVFPLAWVLFDYLRSVGFLGYPWGFLGYTQYAFLPLIQMASVTGVWGVSFVVLLLNSSFAQVLSEVFRRYRRSRESNAGGQPGLAPVYVSAGVFVASVFAGAIYLSTDVYTNPYVQGRSVRIALVQQNSDPRKHNYERTFQTLRRLTDQAKAENPDLIAWSETAFVPNIRRWSREDPRVYPLAGLVREFLGYQKSLGLWLVTGNDDYDLIENEKGEQVRLDYNASVLFSPNGERVATYHKVHLVPFTEHFPYKKQFPWFYELLLNFDVTLWEPGRERRVFSHPLFCFATPICFEDTFPGDIRKFVLNGAEVILNLSNDYWSLTEVEAKQHYISSLFRAVENRRPLLRSTASGFTAYVDPSGRFVRGLPFFEEDYLVVDVGIEPRGISVYTRYGDWFPIAAFLGLLLLGSLFLKKKLSLPKKKA